MAYPESLKWLREFHEYEQKRYDGEGAFHDCEQALLNGDIAYVHQRVSRISWAGMGGFGEYMEWIDPVRQAAFDQFVKAAREAR